MMETKKWLSKERLYLYCDNPECPCEDKCCQDCDPVCERVCESYKYKERVYTDNAYFLSQAKEMAAETDDWFTGVIVDRLEEILQQLEAEQERNKFLDDALLRREKEAFHGAVDSVCKDKKIKKLQDQITAMREELEKRATWYEEDKSIWGWRDIAKELRWVLEKLNGGIGDGC
jgi:hypothetical protein